MKQTDESTWLDDILERRNGYEATAVDAFADRLIRLAQSRLPSRLQQRVDPEDIVQSVFKSFFARHDAGRFQFDQASDVWRLLAAITWHKVQRAIRHHQQLERDVRKEECATTTAALAAMEQPGSDPTASSLVVMMELLDRIMSRLPDKHRDILRLRMEEYSVDEIAKAVGVSSRTVDRALALVRKIAVETLDDS